MFVVKFNNNLYWCGYNTASTQLRKAKIYNSKKMANESGNDCLNRKQAIRLLDTKNQEVEPITSFEIKEVELREV